MMDLYTSTLWFSFFFEFYHSVRTGFIIFLIIEMNYCQLSHVTVLTGYRMLPRKDLVRAKVYFLIDAACAALAFSFHRVSRGERGHINNSLD